MLSSIATERKMSLSHWRYRVLHWYFEVSKEDGYGHNVPRYFYTHYCPLFHFTNLVILFLPIILTWKVTKYIVKNTVVPACGAMAESIRRAKERRAVSAATTSVSEPKETKPRHSFIFCLKKYTDNGDIKETKFERFFDFIQCYGFDAKDRELYEAKFNELYPKLIAAAERRQARAIKMRERVQFWVNFSSVFIKWLLYAGYAALAAGVVWFCAAFGGTGVGWFWYLMTEVDWLAVAHYSLGFLLFGVFIVASVYIQKRFKVFNFFFNSVGAVLSPILNPIGSAIVAVAEGIGNGLASIGEFIRVFFEENCPPITIVSDEEEEIENE